MSNRPLSDTSSSSSNRSSYAAKVAAAQSAPIGSRPPPSTVNNPLQPPMRGSQSSSGIYPMLTNHIKYQTSDESKVGSVGTSFYVRKLEYFSNCV